MRCFYPDKICQYSACFVSLVKALYCIRGVVYDIIGPMQEKGFVSVSYKKLWKLLIDRDMSRAELRRAIGASTATTAKMKRGQLVSSDVLVRICKVLRCDIGDIVELHWSDENRKSLTNNSLVG